MLTRRGDRNRLQSSVQAHRPETFSLPQAAQRPGAFTLSASFAAPARTIAQAPPSIATHPAVCASVTCTTAMVAVEAEHGISEGADLLRCSRIDSLSSLPQPFGCAADATESRRRNPLGIR
jgi:hypothetical protein